MHFTDQWVIYGEKWSKPSLAFNSLFEFRLLPSFAVAVMWLLFIYSLILLGLMNDGKGWSLRQNRKVAPVSSLEGFSFTFPSAEVCVDHCVLCFELTRMDLYTFVLLSPLLLLNSKLENGFHFPSKLGSKHWTEGTVGCKLKVWLV